MKYYPAHRAPAQIGRDPSAEIRRLQHAALWVGLAQSIVAGIVGLIAGLVLGAGYLADLPAWLR